MNIQARSEVSSDHSFCKWTVPLLTKERETLQNTQSLPTDSAVIVICSKCLPTSPAESVSILFCTLARVLCRKIMLIRVNWKPFLKTKILFQFIADFSCSYFTSEELINTPIFMSACNQGSICPEIFLSLHFYAVMDLNLLYIYIYIFCLLPPFPFLLVQRIELYSFSSCERKSCQAIDCLVLLSKCEELDMTKWQK